MCSTTTQYLNGAAYHIFGNKSEVRPRATYFMKVFIFHMPRKISPDQPHVPVVCARTSRFENQHQDADTKENKESSITLFSSLRAIPGQGDARLFRTRPIMSWYLPSNQPYASNALTHTAYLCQLIFCFASVTSCFVRCSHPSANRTSEISTRPFVPAQ